MRFALRTLICTSLVVVCNSAMGAESGSKWWPFGGKQDVTVSQPSSVAPALPPLANPQPSAPAPTTLGNGPLQHEVQMPTDPATSSSKSGWLPKWPTASSSTAAHHNAWAEPQVKPAKPSAMQSVKNGAHKVAAGTKSAYHKTVAALTPGSSKPKAAAAKPPQVARRDVQPPLWKRMLGAKEPALQQPQTVPQWMAQKRLDP